MASAEILTIQSRGVDSSALCPLLSGSCPSGRPGIQMSYPTRFDIVCENPLQYFNIAGEMVPHYVTPGAIYSVDSEGTLYYIPRIKKGASNYFDVQEVAEVEYSFENENDEEFIKNIHSFLISEAKHQGNYFKRPVKRGRPKKAK